MKPHQSQRRAAAGRNIRCEGCGELSPGYDIVNFTSAGALRKSLCTRCFNQQVAALDGLERFEHVRFEPVNITGRDRRVHTFHFRTRLLGPDVAIDAFELRKGVPAGYQFQIIGDAEEDLLALLGRLLEKIRRALSIQHLSKGRFGLQIKDRAIRGRITSVSDSGDYVPLLVVDGREITWEEFGRMCLTFEGWHFQLKMFDKSEEP
ncbi:MAG: hypothetical protein IT167_18765 [Bryobacterales bacterium]|nr:hypothetical protein [Bryobacterales bacterium]